MAIRKIISSNVLGADSAAVDVAKCFSIPCGGYPASKSNINDSMTFPSQNRPPLTEVYTSAVNREKRRPPAEGTLIFSYGPLAGYLDYIHLHALTHGHLCLHLDLDKFETVRAASEIDGWACRHGIETLIVTGTPMHEDNRIYQGTYDALYRFLMLNNSPESAKARRNHPDIDDAWPQTVNEAVQCLLKDLSLKDKAKIATLSTSQLSGLNGTLGAYIRSKFGLDGSNHALWWSCAREAGRPKLTAEEASAIIISCLAFELVQTHKLRLI